jgi:predicted  nucleic acid-binding Zn-ribbon protein
MRTLVLCALLLAGPGCKKEEAAPTSAVCEATVAHLADAMKKPLALACVDTKWSAAVRDCVKAASDPATCKDKMNVDQRSAFAQVATAVEKLEQEAAAAKKAEEVAAQSAKDAAEAQAAVEKLQQDATDLQKRVTEATDALVGAQNQVDRDAAKAKLDQLQKEKVEIDARVAEAKAVAARAERMKGVSISKECLENPLAKGCN